MRKNLIIAVLIASPILIASPAMAKESSTKVEVDGNTYRVFIRDDEVKVFNKSVGAFMKMGRSTERRDQMREAVKRVTNCNLVNDFWEDSWRRGKLDCDGDGIADDDVNK